MASTVTRRSNAALVQRQMPFAIAKALTETARQAQAAVERRIPVAFDRPTPFTLKGVGIKPATKAAPLAMVLVKPTTAAYLAVHEAGGTRTPQPGQPLNVPVQARTNAYGNLPRSFWAKVQRAQEQRPYRPASLHSTRTRKQYRKYGGGIFTVGKPAGRTAHLKPGVYERPMLTRGKQSSSATRLKLLVALEKRAVYERRFGFADTAIATVQRVYGEVFAKALDQALATAR